MRKYLYLTLFFLFGIMSRAFAQDFNQLTDDGAFTQAGNRNHGADSTNAKKEIPRGLKVWTIDERFGDIAPARPDTLSHMFPNTVFTTGMRGEYNTTGNLGSPRTNRIFTDNPLPQQFMFTQPYEYFITPVDKFLFTNTLSPITNITYDECGDKQNGEDHIKALFSVNAGKRLGVGFKFDYMYGRGYYQNQATSHFNYSMYGSYLGDRYQAHILFSTNHQKVTENGGITDDSYITHPEAFDDNFNTNEIPTVLQENWNRNDNQHVFLSHRYNVGFNRKVPMTEEEIKAKKFAMESQKENETRKEKENAEKKAKKEGREFDEKAYDGKKTFSGRPEGAVIAGNEPTDSIGDRQEGRIAVNGTEGVDSLMALEKKKKETEDTAWLKNEYVPVTSFIHTAQFDNYRRIYQAYQTPEDYYLNLYDTQTVAGDSIKDKTNHYRLKNTFAIALLEGFNKWAKAGLKAFVTSDLRHFTLPDSIGGGTNTYNEHNLSLGGQLSKTEGNMLHYNVTAETWITGKDAGQLKMDATADLNFPLFKDTVRLEARGYFYRLAPTFYQRHYHSKHAWWDNDGMDKEIRTRIEGILTYSKTRTSVRVAMDNIKNYTYFSQKYDITENFGRVRNVVNVNQHSGNINVMTLQLNQDFTLGPLNWESQITYQKSSNENVIPVPTLNVYSNLYLRFRVAKVLKIDLGADVRFFTKYYAPDYSPLLGQYTTQDNGENNVETGNYPVINAYANMHLKNTRFFLMMSHVNASSGGEYFYTPHYPLNGRILRFGISWNFFN